MHGRSKGKKMLSTILTAESLILRCLRDWGSLRQSEKGQTRRWWSVANKKHMSTSERYRKKTISIGESKKPVSPLEQNGEGKEEEPKKK